MSVPSLSGAPALSTLHHHQNIATSGPSMIQNCPQLLSTPPPPCGAAISSATNAQMHHGNPLNTAPPVSHPPPNSIVTFIHHQPNITNTIAPSVSGGMIVGDPRMVKLVHAHRVGMKALETMGNRNHDDNRSYAKFSQNPAYADDVRWLFSIAVKLGGVFTQSFCEVAARSIASPFVLFSLAVESTKVFHWQMPQISYHSQALLHPIIRSQMANGSSNSKHNHAPQVRRLFALSHFRKKFLPGSQN
ncbi:unnamed protein product [Anisakis simplex]|uniref:ZSWIM4-8 C-terminal domain-containing protein n=1 Tax=Anisakis simplex TaxID=6269 RepID=A0A0M3J9F7_ANISI|nr:unnamed protein product [Anisakis simplex]